MSLFVHDVDQIAVWRGPPNKIYRVRRKENEWIPLKMMKNDDDDDGAQQLRREEWKHDALREYELIAVLCNAQSVLVDAVASSSSSSLMLGVSRSNTTTSNEDNTSLQMLTSALQQRKVTESLAAYYEAIDNVRTVHASLKARLSLLSSVKLHHKSSNDDSNSNNIIGIEENGVYIQQQRQRQRRSTSNTPNNEFMLHTQLVERVIRTVMRMSSPPNNQSNCVGVLYTNGIIDIPSQNEYETNIVALAAVRASLSQLSLMI